MAGPRTVPDDELRQSLAAYEAAGRNYAKAARDTGVSRSTIQGHVKLAAERLTEKPLVELPTFPDEDAPIEDVIDLMSKRFTKRRASYEAHTWYKVGIKENKPIGVLWFGDPHVDDNGCNWPILRRHCELCRTTEGLYGGNVGDTTNNWSGRLAHLYAKQDSSKSTAQRLAEWFMLESGITWLVFLIGNHDAWSDGAAVLAQMAKRGTHKIVMHDWEARFSLKFPNGYEAKINAAHDFKGHSDWNEMHALLKAGKLGTDTDLLIAGHRHMWGIQQFENPQRKLVQTFVRVRGYKFDDEFTRHIGKYEQQGGCAILTIFDPISRRITTYDDIEDGVEFLKWKRARIS